MSRTLEIDFYGYEYIPLIEQIKNVTLDDVKDFPFYCLDELSKIAKYDVDMHPHYFGFGFFSTGSIIISNITIKQDDIVELAINKDAGLFDVFHIDYPKLFYWSDNKELDSDIQLIKLDERFITCCGFSYNKASSIASLEDFEGDFDEKFITAIVSEPESWFECWKEPAEFLYCFYYKDKALSFQTDGSGKGDETFYYDKGWNRENPILYYREPKIDLKELLNR